MALRETENNAYAKFWGDKQRALWYVMVFSGVVNCFITHRFEENTPSQGTELTFDLFLEIIHYYAQPTG